MSQQQVNLSPKVLLSATVQNLNQQFFADDRVSSKRLFKDILEGQRVPFMHIAMGSKGEVNCYLELDYSEYIGKLNYGNFRKSVAVMLMEITKLLESGEDSDIAPTMLSSEEGDILFNIPGITESDGDINAIAFGLKQPAPGIANIQLMYLDPSNFVRKA